MRIDNSGRVLSFSEKPKGEALQAMQVDTTVLGLSAEQSAGVSLYRFDGDLCV